MTHAARLPLIKITKNKGMMLNVSHLFFSALVYMYKNEKTERIEQICEIVFLG
jgi:CRISPR/Cas system-associated endonuclease Cas3-HD